MSLVRAWRLPTDPGRVVSASQQYRSREARAWRSPIDSGSLVSDMQPCRLSLVRA